jgi:hypothetical protein
MSYQLLDFSAPEGIASRVNRGGKTPCLSWLPSRTSGTIHVRSYVSYLLRMCAFRPQYLLCGPSVYFLAAPDVRSTLSSLSDSRSTNFPLWPIANKSRSASFPSTCSQFTQAL